MRPLTVCAILVLTTLAGCSEEAAPVDEDDALFGEVEAKATDTTGLIRGVVVDPAITPLSGAVITLVGQEQTMETDETGIFVFTDLNPGPYFLKVDKVGYESQQASANVIAGEDKPPIVRVMLEADPESVPFIDASVWEGFFTCSSAALQVCPLADLVLCIGGACDVFTDEFITTVPIEQPPTWINSELVWTPTQVAARELDFYLEWVSKADSSDWEYMRSVEGTSPLLITVDEAEAAALGFGAANDMRHRTFPRLAAESAIFLDQRFTVYTHEFYNFAPPEDWRITEDEPPSPPQ